MSTLEQIENRPAGVGVIVRMSLDDPRALGHWLAGRGSDEQAMFLYGLAEGFAEMGPLASGKQVMYVREHAAREGYNLAPLLALLNDYLGAAS